jgi:hypothetical protein
MSSGAIRCMSKRANCPVHFSEAMNSRAAINGLLLIGLLFTQFRSSAQAVPGYTLPNDLGEAWAEVVNLHRDLRRRPDDWRAKQPSPEQIAAFQQEVRKRADLFVDKAFEFIERFHPSIHPVPCPPAAARQLKAIHDAHLYVLDALGRAAAAGDRDAVGRIRSFIDMVLADKTIPEDWQVMAFLAAGSAMDKQEVGMRLFTFTDSGDALREEFKSAGIKHAREALKRFPRSFSLLQILFMAAEHSTGEQQRELLSEVLDTPGTPPGAKTVAEHMLKGTKPYEVGKALDAPEEVGLLVTDGANFCQVLKFRFLVLVFTSDSLPGIPFGEQIV